MGTKPHRRRGEDSNGKPIGNAGAPRGRDRGFAKM
jgi:hypothetical protein